MSKKAFSIPSRQMREPASAAEISARQMRLTKSGRTATVHVFDYIDWLGFDVAYYGPALDSMRDIDEIVIKINSPGGSAFDGVAFYNTVVNHPAKKKRVEVHGLAGSAASVIAMAGDEILMGTGARFFIHKPWAIGVGNDDVFFKMAEDLKSFNDDFVTLYKQQASKLSRDEILQIMKDETEYSAAQSIEKGFATGRLNEDDDVKADAAPKYSPVRTIEDLRRSLTKRAARLIRPDDKEKPALSEMRRRADILKATRTQVSTR